VRAQIEGERLHAFAPRAALVGEDVVVHLAQEPLDECLDHGGLVREVRVDGVRGDADARGDASHGRRVRASVVQEPQRGIEDLVLGQGSSGTAAARERGCRHWRGLPP
jgi:hypothetical protein